MHKSDRPNSNLFPSKWHTLFSMKLDPSNKFTGRYKHTLLILILDPIPTPLFMRRGAIWSKAHMSHHTEKL